MKLPHNTVLAGVTIATVWVYSHFFKFGFVIDMNSLFVIAVSYRGGVVVTTQDPRIFGTRGLTVTWIHERITTSTALRTFLGGEIGPYKDFGRDSFGIPFWLISLIGALILTFWCIYCQKE